MKKQSKATQEAIREALHKFLSRRAKIANRARNKSLSAAKRKAIARKAIRARWAKKEA